MNKLISIFFGTLVCVMCLTSCHFVSPSAEEEAVLIDHPLVRTISRAEYCTVEASSEEEAIETAKLLGEECWEENPNDVYMDYYNYNAELI